MGQKRKEIGRKEKERKKKKLCLNLLPGKKMYFVLINNVVRLNSVGLYISYN